MAHHVNLIILVVQINLGKGSMNYFMNHDSFCLAVNELLYSVVKFSTVFLDKLLVIDALHIAELNIWCREMLEHKSAITWRGPNKFKSLNTLQLFYYG